MKTADEFCDWLRDIWNNRLGFPHSEIRDELVGWKRDIELEARQIPLTDPADAPLWRVEMIDPPPTVDLIGELRARLEQLEGRVERLVEGMFKRTDGENELRDRMERVEAIANEKAHVYAPPIQSLVETVAPEATESEA